LQFNETLVTETISVALLFYPGLRLVLSRCKQWFYFSKIPYMKQYKLHDLVPTLYSVNYNHFKRV